jgi:RNA 3'-terminal phosphate cyclase (ATP)
VADQRGSVEIDGSYGEGGGQIIRTSLSLSAITGRTLEITAIRAKRSRPGLQPQHLAAVRAAAELCGAELSGDAAGSSSLRFTPTRLVQAGDYCFDIRTAGAAPLVAQTVALPLVLAGGPSTVHITGGTHVPHAPPADYLEAVYLPALRMRGVPARVEYPRAGFFPKGGGEILLRIDTLSHPLSPLRLIERGELRSLTAFVVTAELPEHVGRRGASAIEKFMKGVGRKVRVELRDCPALNPGAAVVLAAECEEGLAGFTSLGERGKPVERVAEEACQQFMAWWKSGAACDEHLADQLVLPAVLTPGESRWTTPVVTEHLRTVLWVAGRFLPVQSSIEESGTGAAAVTVSRTA